MKLQEVLALGQQAVESWLDDYAPSMGAAIAYYTIFSIAPLLLIVTSVAGLIFGMDAARGQIVGELRGLMGEEGALAVQTLLANVNRPAQGIFGTAIGLVVLLVGATTVFGELQDALDRIWRAPLRSRRSGLWKLVRARLLSFGMILGIGFLLMVSLIFSAVLSAMGRWWNPVFGDWATLAALVNFVFSFAFTTALFAMIYKIMPRVRIEWRDVTIGAAVTALLFTFGKYLIGLYIGTSSITSGFGAAGSLAVLVVWVYYSAQIFLLGAEFTWIYSHTYGSRRGLPRPGRSEALPPTSGVPASTVLTSPAATSRSAATRDAA